MTETKDLEAIVMWSNHWGKASNSMDALQNMLEQVRKDKLPEEVEVEIVKVKGFQQFSFHSIQADEIVSSEKVVMDGDLLRRILNHLEQAELTAEEALVEAEEVEE